MAHGEFFWHELCSPDPAKDAGFYKALFGWTTSTMPMPGMPDSPPYTLWHQGEKVIGGAMPMQGEMWKGIPPHWMLYVAVDDVEATVVTAVGAGGKVMHAPFDVEGVGRIAVFADPAGAVFSVIQPAPSAT
jgi:predicted enzyme related to lactoylglutathione lyase